MKKNVWKKPNLVVLVRGKPEEAVLGFCKLDVQTVGPLGGDCGRGTDPPPPFRCQEVTQS